MGSFGESKDYSKQFHGRNLSSGNRNGGVVMRTVQETKSYKDRQTQEQNNSAIGELSIMLAQMQEQNDSAIGELSIMLAQIMGGTTE